MTPPTSAGVEPLDTGADQLDLFEARQQVLVGHLQLETREVRTQAEVLAHTESQVAVRVAVDAEGEGILEDLLVAVRRGVEERQRLALP